MMAALLWWPYLAESKSMLISNSNKWELKRSSTSSVWKAEKDGGQKSKEMTVGSSKLKFSNSIS